MSGAYNLLRERWLPVRYTDGRVEMIGPWEITKPHEDRDYQSRDLAAARPDVNGALAQFLIGLVQTTLAPRTPREWRRRFDWPPTPDELAEAFRPVAPAFDLHTDTNGGGFMQDQNPLSDDPNDEKPAGWLLIDAPTENALETNKDHFTHRLDARTFSLAEAAAVLYTLQTFAPAGGPGMRTSLRGGGPLTTLVLGKTLWETVWLNVLTADDLAALGDAAGNPTLSAPSEIDPETLAAVFPWVGPTRTSDRDEPTTRDDVHPLQAFWGMPRRIRLRIRPDETTGEPRVTHFVEKPRGTNYDGSWEHPLSPYSTTRDGTLIAQHGSADRLSYRHWVGLVANRGATRPAQVVRALPTRAPREWLRKRLGEPRLWASGYDMKSAKARLWIESRQMPLVLADPAVRERVAETAEHLVATADLLEKALTDALRLGRLGRTTLERGRYKRAEVPKPLKSASGSFIEQALRRFWTDTEPDFYAALDRARSVCEADPDGDLGARLLEGHETWLKAVRKKVIAIYDEATQAAPNPGAVVEARQRLRYAATPTSWSSREVCKALGLPAPPKPRKRTPKEAA